MVLQTALKYFTDSQWHNVANGPTKSLPHFITSNLEHDSIKLVLEQFEKQNLAGIRKNITCYMYKKIHFLSLIIHEYST